MVCLLWLSIPVVLLIILLLIVAIAKLTRRPVGWIRERSGRRSGDDGRHDLGWQRR